MCAGWGNSWECTVCGGGVMDRAMLQQFIDNMIGFRSIGVDSNCEEVVTPICPEMRSFLTARLGEKLPNHGFYAVSRPDGRATMIAFFREVVDALDALS